MTLGVLFYDIVLMSLYVVTITVAFFTYKIKKTDTALVVAILFVVFFIDHIIISMTEIIPSFGAAYEKIFLTVPSAKTLVYVACFLLLFALLPGKDKLFRYKKLSIVAGLCFVTMMLIPLMENSSLKSYLYFLPSQVFFFVYGLTGRMAVQLREENAHGKVHEAIRKYKSFIFTVMIVFSMVIALEDLVVIFNVDSYIGNISIFNRSVSEDIMRIIIAIASIRAFSGILGGKFGSEAGAKKGKPVDPVEAFAKEHQFTEREKEIFARILKNKSNQEISEELFLSLGTVKTHTHNIFNKLDVTKRREAAEIFDEFREELEAEVETE